MGDGNISARIDYSGNISSAEMELVINDEFEVFVNGNSLGTLQKSISEFTPSTYNISTQHFQSGENLVEIKGNNLHIAGGFIKITYSSDVEFQQPTRYKFPGIEGLINLYDGMYIPSDLTSILVSLHMNSPTINTFLNIGGVTVYNSTTVGEQTIILTDTDLISLGLSHGELSKTTTPIRLGMENVSLTINASLDIISVTDKSTNMQCTVSTGNCAQNPNTCASCGGIWLLPLNQSRDANILLVEQILQFLNNRIGVLGFHSQVAQANHLSLSNDTDFLLNDPQRGITNWDETYTGGNHKLCQAIIETEQEFIDNSAPDKIKIAIVMSAGTSNLGCGLTNQDLNNNGIFGDEGDDAIQAACNLRNNQDVIIHAVGYGAAADSATLEKIAECGNGQYYFADITDLVDLYQNITNDILINYLEQSVEASGEVFSRLYSDSYIEFTYDEIPPPFGLIITTENKFSNETSGNFTIPQNATIVDTRVISYSGPRWTNTISTNNNQFYNLADYGNNYISLGDPYTINIPNLLLRDNNDVYLTTASSPQNFTVGSASNKIISTIAREVISFSPISPRAEGCKWEIQFEDDSEINVTVPNTYFGPNKCFYTEAEGQVYDSTDALQATVMRLLQQLDLNFNNKVDVVFTEQDLQIDLSEVTGIPYTWSTEVQVRIWR